MGPFSIIISFITCLNLCLWLYTDIILLNLSFKYLKVTTSDLIMKYDHSTHLEVEVMDIVTHFQMQIYAVCVFICSKIVPVIKLNMKVAKSKVLMQCLCICVYVLKQLTCIKSTYSSM